MGESSPVAKGPTRVRLKLPNSTLFRCVLRQKQEKKKKGGEGKTKQTRNKTTVLQYESLKNSKVACKFDKEATLFKTTKAKEVIYY